MRIRTKLAMVEKRMQVTNLGRRCPLCHSRPPEVVCLEHEGQEVPPSQAPPCPLCGKAPTRIILAR